jgi:hypothetical protein
MPNRASDLVAARTGQTEQETPVQASRSVALTEKEEEAGSL